MKNVFLLFITVVGLGACCKAIQPKGDNYTLFVEVRKSDDIAAKGSTCDGDIIIENPRGAGVSYQWSHNSSLTGHRAGNLCAGMYKITVTDGSKTRVTQVMIN